MAVITQKAHETYKRVLEGVDVCVCDLTWWRKPENLGKTTDLEQATTSLPDAYTRIRILSVTMTSNCFTTAISRRYFCYNCTWPLLTVYFKVFDC